MDVDVDWFNILFSKCENTVEAHFNDDHFYILSVRAPQLYYFCVVDYHANVNSNWSRRSTQGFGDQVGLVAVSEARAATSISKPIPGFCTYEMCRSRKTPLMGVLTSVHWVLLGQEIPIGIIFITAFLSIRGAY